MDASTKKGLPIYLMRILDEYSDENHPLTQNKIAQLIEQNFGVSFDRRTVSSGIELLVELDYDIIKVPNVGYFMGERRFDKTEVSYIIDALFSSKSLEGNDTKKLADKVSLCLSKYDRKSFRYVYKSNEVNKTNNKQVFYNIAIINEAIEKRKCIQCRYESYDEFGKPSFAKDGFYYYLSPYYLISNQGRYYLLCSYNAKKYHHLNTFRIDYLNDISIIEGRDRDEIESLGDNFKDFSIANYLNEHIYLFGGNAIKATLKLNDPSVIRYIYDWFGKNASIENKGTEIYAKVKCNELGLFYWIMQYGEHLKVLEPQTLVDKVYKAACEIKEKYEDSGSKN